MPEIAKGLNDKFAGLREFTIIKLATTPYKTDKVVLEEVERIAKTENNKKAKAAAINFLVKNGDAKYAPIFKTAITDSSYTVAGAALKGLVAADAANAYTLAKTYGKNAKGALSNAVIDVLIAQGTDADFTYVADAYRNAPLSQEKLMLNDKFANYLVKLNDEAKIKEGIDRMLEFRNAIPMAYRSYVDPSFSGAFNKIVKAKGANIDAYVKERFK